MSFDATGLRIQRKQQLVGVCAKAISDLDIGDLGRALRQLHWIDDE
jgi:hypothetical protein